MTVRSFDIGNAIFHFFKRFGENPGGALWIMICQTVLVGLLAAAGVALFVPVWDNLSQLIILDDAGQLSDEEAVRRVFGMLMPIMGFMPFIALAGIALALMSQAAWLRFLTRGEVKPGLPFRLGGDEFRLLGVNLLYWVLGVVIYFGFMTFFAISVVGAGVAAGGRDANVFTGAAGGLIVALIVLVLLIAVLVIAVRMACAPALTVHQSRFRFFESWTATRGVFWHMLVSYIAVAVMAFILSSIIGGFIQLAFLGALWPVLMEFITLEASGAKADPQQVIDAISNIFANPVTMGMIGLGFVLSYLMQIVWEGMWHGVAAYNAQRVGEEGSADDRTVLERDHPMGASPREG